MGVSYEIEPARDEDVPAVVQLIMELFSIEKDFKPDARKQRLGIELLRQFPYRGMVLVARGDGDRVLGVATAQIVFSTAEGAASVWVEDVVVQKPFRGSGIGRALLKGLEDWGRQHGATRMQLVVDLENAPAVAFYDRLGWQRTQLAVRRLLL